MPHEKKIKYEKLWRISLEQDLVENLDLFFSFRETGGRLALESKGFFWGSQGHFRREGPWLDWQPVWPSKQVKQAFKVSKWFTILGEFS